MRTTGPVGREGHTAGSAWVGLLTTICASAVFSLSEGHCKTTAVGFPGGAVVKNPPANAGDMGSSPGPGRSHMPRSN